MISRGLACSILVVACGGGGRPSVLPDPPPAPAPITVDTIVNADSTRCLLSRLAQSDEPLSSIVTTWSTPAVADVAYRAALSRAVDDEERASLHYRHAGDRALAGDLDAARDAHAEAKRLAGDAMVLGEGALRLWLGDPPDEDVRLPDIPYLVRGGHRAAAEELFDAGGAPPEPGDPEYHPDRAIVIARSFGAALSALGRIDELERRIGASEPTLAAGLARGWLDDAVVTGADLDAAVAAVIATGVEELPTTLFERAHYLGRGAALAPLAAAMRAAPGAKPDVNARLAEVYLAILVGDHAQARSIADAVADAPAPDTELDRRPLAPLYHAFAGGSLDDGLTAILAYDGVAAFEVTGHFYGALWARHVAEGFDAEFDRRLTDAVCGHPPGCLVDAVGWSTVRVGPGGAAADLDALRAGKSETCGHWGINYELTIVLSPGGRATDAVETIAAAFAAGYRQVDVRELAAPDDLVVTPRSCTWTHAPVGTAPEDAGYVYVAVDGIEASVDEDGEYGESGEPPPPLDASAGPDEIIAWAEAMREVVPSSWLSPAAVEIAVEDDITTEGLARILFPLCATFKAVHFHQP